MFDSFFRGLEECYSKKKEEEEAAMWRIYLPRFFFLPLPLPLLHLHHSVIYRGRAREKVPFEITSVMF